MAEAKLYVIPGSHPSRSAMLMLERKGIPYKRVDLIPVVSKGVVRAQRFPGVTVPALKLDGTRVQGSTEIARELDRIQPDPPLFPSDPELRAKVEEAETWGNDFQQKPRQLIWWAFRRNRAPMASYSEGARLGVPVGLAAKTGGPIVSLSARFNGATDANVSADLASLRPDLDRIDAWIVDGVIGGPQPNAADFQIAPSLRLLMTFDDLRSSRRGPVESWPSGSCRTSQAGCRRSSRRSGSRGCAPRLAEGSPAPPAGPVRGLRGPRTARCRRAGGARDRARVEVPARIAVR